MNASEPISKVMEQLREAGQPLAHAVLTNDDGTVAGLVCLVTGDETFRARMQSVFDRAEYTHDAGRTVSADPERMALDAIRYVLTRAQTDPDFGYYMLGTEAMERLIRAEASMTGQDEAVVWEHRRQDLRPAGRRQASIEVLRARLAELEQRS